MLVALESFVAQYDGKPTAIHRGRTRVSEDHELARRYPARFVRDVRREREQRVRERALLERGLLEYLRRQG